MKKLIYILMTVAVLALTACNDHDDHAFDPGITSSAFSFKPMTGGAVMHFSLPNDPTIVGLHVRYKDAYGDDIMRSASNLCDSVSLIGFNEARTDIPATVTLIRKDEQESAPIPVSFSTLDSGPVAFMKSAQVDSNWGGFTLKYTAPENTRGMAHVFYLGTDPLTGESDTVLVSSFNIEETDSTEIKSYKIKQDIKNPTIVLKAEDFRGHIVETKTYTGIECLESEKLNPSLFSFYCDNAIIETTEYMVSPLYLFDGDTKGLLQWDPDKRNKFYTFLAGPHAAGDEAHPMYMDMRKNYTTASLRLYSMLVSTVSPYWQIPPMNLYLYQQYMMPCDVDIYGAKDDGNNEPLEERDMSTLQWVKLGTFKQDKTTDNDSRWCPHTQNPNPRERYTSRGAMEAADEEFMEIVFPAHEQGEGYRYLKMVVNEVFDITLYPQYFSNSSKYVTFNELEIYTKKD